MARPILGWNTFEPSNHPLEQSAGITHQPEQIRWEIETTVQQVETHPLVLPVEAAVEVEPVSDQAKGIPEWLKAQFNSFKILPKRMVKAAPNTPQVDRVIAVLKQAKKEAARQSHHRSERGKV